MERDESCKELEFLGSKIVVFQSGEIWRFHQRWNRWTKIDNTANHIAGYNLIGFGKKLCLRHRIIGMVFLELNIDDPSNQIDHIDGNRTNNSLVNLRIVNNQQNHFNQTKAKGYTWDKQYNKWHAQIHVNGRNIYLGRFDNEADAHSAYLSAKLVHHQI